MDIEKFLALQSSKKIQPEPLILDLSKSTDRSRLKSLIKKGAIRNVRDDYEEQLKEYFAIKKPALCNRPDFEKSHWQDGRWIYFPWSAALTHVLEDEKFQIVRTARNRNLINEEEQRKFYNSTVGIAGLSVGNSVALAIVLQGGARHIKLADFDYLALSNLNRIRAGIDELGMRKVEIAARQIYALNPYAKIECFSEGLTKDNIAKFFAGPPRLDIVIDEIDDLPTKTLIREFAKKHSIPVVMGTDNGDNAVIDIERYDKNPDLEFFHGRMGKISYEALSKMSKFELGKLIGNFVGMENVPLRMRESLMEVGKTLVSWPQLGGAALLNGCAVAYCTRKILNGQPLESDRVFISLDEKLIPRLHHTQNRLRKINKLRGQAIVHSV